MMIDIDEFLVKSNLRSFFKKYNAALTYSFVIGLLIGSIPFISKSKENFRVQKLIQKQRKIEIQNKEKICKDSNSDYEKFLNLGFPKTAIEKLKICMKEQ